LPRRCKHGAWHEETYFEIIDGLNKEKPMPEARSLRRLSPNCGPAFLPLRENGRMLTPITYHHQSLALGIGADALGELYWLPDELPDALR
jgi:hypothetical protein